MDSQKFLDAFGHIADAPGGVARLRELILQLAITGSLVPKDENGASVETDLAQARKLHSEYVEALELRKTVPHLLIENIPFPVPTHWAWERLERLCLYIQRGKGPSYVDRSSTRVISQKCVQWSGFDLAPSRFVSDDAIQGYGPERLLRNGDLLWNSTGTGTAGRVAIYDNEEPISAVADSHVTVIRLANFEPRYVWCVIAAPWIQVRINPDHPDSLVSGTTKQVELATNSVRALEIPCPPIEEQKRIVAKVDELLTLCDQRERQQEARRSLQVKARKALIQRVASASASGEVHSAWGKLTSHLPDLFSSPDDVSDLNLLLFKSASRGLLSKSSDEDANLPGLLNALELQRKSEFSIRQLRELNSLPQPEFENGGVFLCLGHVAKVVSGQHLTPEEYTSSRIGIPYITGPAEFRDSYPNPSKWTEQRRAVALDGDILLTVKGSGVGKTARCNLDELAISRQLMAVRALSGINPDYLELCLLAARDVFSAQKTGIAIPGIGRDEVLALRLFMPDLEAQCRIVAQVNELVNLCTTMENQLRQARSTAELLAQAAVSSITGIAITEEEAELKAPQTELIAPLRIGTPPSGSAQAPLASILVRHSGALSAKDLWQRFGGEIDSFYAQLKHEVAHGWLVEPEVAEMREQESA